MGSLQYGHPTIVVFSSALSHVLTGNATTRKMWTRRRRNFVRRPGDKSDLENAFDAMILVPKPTVSASTLRLSIARLVRPKVQPFSFYQDGWVRWGSKCKTSSDSKISRPQT